MGDLLEKRSNKAIQVNIKPSEKLEIVYNVCFNAFSESMKSKDRRRSNVFLRSLYFKLAREMSADSLMVIGKLIGKDHATVLHGINVIFENDIKRNDTLYKEYLQLKKEIKTEIILKRSTTNFRKTEAAKLIHSKINLKEEIEKLKGLLTKQQLKLNQAI